MSKKFKTGKAKRKAADAADKRRQKIKKPQKNPDLPNTPNGKLIYNLMEAKKVKGNWRDYVAMSGSRLIDAFGSWDMFSPTGDPLGIEGVGLIHKSRLKSIIGDKFASRFWNDKLGTRVPPTQKESNKNAV